MACEITCKEIETVRKIDGEWKSSLSSPEQFRLTTVESKSVVFIFAEADRVRECTACRIHFENTFQMPELWWFSWCRRANGYFGSEEKVDSEGKIDAHNTWFRFIIKRFLPEGQTEDNKDYVWYKFNIFTHWDAKTSATYVLVFDARKEVKSLIVGSLGVIDPRDALEEHSNEKDSSLEATGCTIRVNEGDSHEKHKENRSKQKDKTSKASKTKVLPKKDVNRKGFTPTRLLDRITDRIFINPYAIHILFLEDVVYQQDESVWGIRNRLRDFEKKRSSNPNYEGVHDIARHAIHVSETLDTAICTVSSIRNEHDEFQKAQEPEKRKDLKPEDRRKKEDNEGARVRRGLDFSDSMLRNLRCRSQSNMTRLQNEIQLSYNIVSQNIGHATKADSKAMLGIAFLTVIFLPPTFMCSVFSMTFFNYDPEKDRLVLSDRFWVYWATTVPITVVTCIAMALWLSSTKVKNKGIEMSAEMKKEQLEPLLQRWKNRRGDVSQSSV